MIKLIKLKNQIKDYKKNINTINRMMMSSI